MVRNLSLQELQELQPETAVVVLSGWSNFDDLQP
jgi:YesN/AraC family two-component response regulator